MLNALHIYVIIFTYLYYFELFFILFYLSLMKEIFIRFLFRSNTKDIY